MKYFATLCMTIVVVVLTSSAAVADDEVGLSLDRTTWGPTLTDPLFDPDFRWVPGDDETASFYVRNQGPTRAYMTITARSADTDELLSNEDIDLRARAAGGPWVDLENNVASPSLLDASIGRGDVVRVDVNVLFDFASPNESQLDRLRAAFDVTLTQDPTDTGDPGGPGDGGDGSSGGVLPQAGGPAAAVFFLAVASLGVGLGFVRRSQPEQEMQ